MQLIQRTIEYTGNQTFTIRPLGDIHLGTRHHDKTMFQRDVESVAADPNCFWIGMGDYCESISIADPRFAPDEVAREFRDQLGTIACAQRDAFVRAVSPIASRCIGLLEGNHEFENRRRHYVDIVRDACRELDTQYLGDTAMVRLTFQRTGEDSERMCSDVLTIYCEHGTGGGRKTGGKVNSLEDLMASFDADIYLRGHVHQKLITKHPRLSVPSRGSLQLKARTRLCALTGCYYRTYERDSSSYGERKSYAPTELGSVAIRFHPRTGEMEAIS